MPLPKVYTRENVDQFRSKYIELDSLFGRVHSRIPEETGDRIWDSLTRAKNALERIGELPDNKLGSYYDLLESTYRALDSAGKLLSGYEPEGEEDFQALKELFADQSRRVDSLRNVDEPTYRKALQELSACQKNIDEEEQFNFSQFTYTWTISEALKDLANVDKLMADAKQTPVGAGV